MATLWTIRTQINLERERDKVDQAVEVKLIEMVVEGVIFEEPLDEEAVSIGDAGKVGMVEVVKGLHRSAELMEGVE